MKSVPLPEAPENCYDKNWDQIKGADRIDRLMFESESILSLEGVVVDFPTISRAFFELFGTSTDAFPGKGVQEDRRELEEGRLSAAMMGLGSENANIGIRREVQGNEEN